MQDVPSNQTLLLPNNTVMLQSFAQLAELNNISHPETFLDRLLEIADINYEPPREFYDTSIMPSNQEAAGIVLLGFVYVHLIDRAVDFYSNDTV